MAVLIAGIGEYKVSNKPGDVIKTYALGSCIAILVYDKVAKIAGLVHIALPNSSASPEKAKLLPGYFADTGIPVLIEEMSKYGASKKNLWFKLVGGANISDPKAIFEIGVRNIVAIKEILLSKNIRTIADDIGGDSSRTVSIDVENGNVSITRGKKTWTI